MKIFRKAIGLLAVVIVLSSIAVPALADTPNEPVGGITGEQPTDEQGLEADALDPKQSPVSDHGTEPSPESSPEPALPMKPLTDYWWVLLIAAALLGACIMIMKNRKPMNLAQPAGSPHSPPLRIGNMHHIGARETQQDSFVISDVSNSDLCGRKGVLGVVADGMGGMADGGAISAIVTRTMLQYFNEAGTSGQPELDLLNMLYASNDNVNRFLTGRGKGGSTVVAVIIIHGQLYWIAVGDSRICLIRNGAIIQINREHVYAVDLDERAATGEISWEDAANDPQREALTNYLGMGKLEKTDRNIRPMQLLPGDRVLLMSDGVFGVLSENEILEAMPFEPFQSAMALQEKVLAKQRPNQDNLTAVIIEYN